MNEPSEKEQREFLEQSYQYSQRFNTGYQLAKSLDNPNLPQKEKQDVQKVLKQIENSNSKDGDYIEPMYNGMKRYRHDKEKERMKQKLQTRKQDRDRDR